MIRDIKELLNEDFNLRHFIQHTSIDVLNDSKATKEDLINSVMKGIENWKMHMIQSIIENDASMKNVDENKRKSISGKKRKQLDTDGKEKTNE
jgi:hypothetical protein